MKRKGFGGMFKRLRKKTGLGIKRLAPHLGVTYSYLSKLENGATLPSEELIYRTARYFSCDPNPLLLAAGKIPRDVLRILQEHPEDAFVFLKDRFGGGVNASKQRS
jgi:transcriptional regulator with XRE-family HTH domain